MTENKKNESAPKKLTLSEDDVVVTRTKRGNTGLGTQQAGKVLDPNATRGPATDVDA